MGADSDSRRLGVQRWGQNDSMIRRTSTAGPKVRHPRVTAAPPRLGAIRTNPVSFSAKLWLRSAGTNTQPAPAPCHSEFKLQRARAGAGGTASHRIMMGIMTHDGHDGHDWHDASIMMGMMASRPRSYPRTWKLLHRAGPGEAAQSGAAAAARTGRLPVSNVASNWGRFGNCTESSVRMGWA